MENSFPVSLLRRSWIEVMGGRNYGNAPIGVIVLLIVGAFMEPVVRIVTFHLADCLTTVLSYEKQAPVSSW